MPCRSPIPWLDGPPRRQSAHARGLVRRPPARRLVRRPARGPRRPRGDPRRGSSPRARHRRRSTTAPAPPPTRPASWASGRTPGPTACASPTTAEARFGRKVAWGAECGEERAVFTSLSVPVMTRLRMPERRVLDTLVDAGVARSRSEALAWCVRLVRHHEGDWIERAPRRPRARRGGPGPGAGVHARWRLSDGARTVVIRGDPPVTPHPRRDGRHPPGDCSHERRERSTVNYPHTP